MPFIIGITGPFAGMSIPLAPAGSMMFGRDEVACQVVFPASTQGVSRHHCVLKFNPQTGMFIIYDSGSSYGTFLQNGSKIDSTPVALRNGERFYLGAPTNTFEVRL